MIGKEREEKRKGKNFVENDFWMKKEKRQGLKGE